MIVNFFKRGKHGCALVASLVLLLSSTHVFSASRHTKPADVIKKTTARIAIVIDDIGYQSSDQLLLNIDAPLSYAVLPHTPLGYRYALQATKNNRDVLIHLPMQADHNNHLLGSGALTSKMNKVEYQQTLLSAMEDIPFAIGINNHMGSLLTRMEQPMRWTMEVLQQHNMFFLDSKTTRHSKVEQLAKQFGVTSLNRNIFLDHSREKRHMEHQFQRLINIAQNYGSAIGIGHPYKETYELLQVKLPQLQKLGIEVVPISVLLTPNAGLVNNRKAPKDNIEQRARSESE
ncbi:MAG: divergent polysaccharide deacetylase family protein [Gammaproteobacteria bacterium]|nr:divergent polysaccharide deacetylase family protein [Gammaproteobacteria bacterium]